MGFKEKYIKKQRDLNEVGIRPPFPKIVKIDICNVCNYACVFCPQAKQTKKVGNIDKELCLNIIKDSFDEGARELCLSMTGEPLINTNLEYFIKYAKDMGYEYVFFNTNGYLCDEKRGRDLIDAGLDSIKFSVNADQESYEAVHGVDGFYKVVENIKKMYEYRNQTESKCKIYISYVAMIPTLVEGEALKERMKGCCDDMVIINANNRAGSVSELDNGLFAGNDEYSFTYPCSQLFNNVYVTAEGYMIICCQDFENLTVVADLNKVSVSEAWNGKKFTAFREKYLNRDLEGTLCYNCFNNSNENVVPLTKECVGYATSQRKIDNLNSRIKRLLNMKEENE